MAFFNMDAGRNSEPAVVIMPVQGGPIIKRFDLAQGYLSISYVTMRWTRDGRALLYVKKDGDTSAIWSQSLDGSPPKPVSAPQDGRILDFDVSPDGKQFVIARGRQVGDIVMNH